MNDKLIISLALLELAKNSETSFLDTGKEDKEIVDAAKKIGIVLPSPDLIVMKTIYAEIDKVNLNGVILPKKAVEKGLATLIGKQCNWEHEGAGFVCGYTISAKINKDKIETINVLFKSLFPKQVNELIEKVKTKEAAVSFEIWNIDPETKKSVVKDLDNGFKEISPIICHGTGVLLIHPPACPNAKIFKVVAKEEIRFSEELCFATLAIEKSECKHCDNCENHKEVDKVEIPEKIVEQVEAKAKEEQKLEDAKKHLCPECKQPMKEDEEICAECKKKKEEASQETKAEVKPEETKAQETVAAETKPEEPKAEETKEVVAEKKEEKAQEMEVIEPKVVVKITRIYSEVRVDTFVDGTPSGTESVKGFNKKITEYQDGTKDEIEEEVKIEKKYNFAELEEAVNKAKEELITLHKAELEAKTNEVKVELEKKIQEKETEIANLKKEKEIAIAKEEETTPPTLEVGDVSKKDTNPYKERQKQINKIAYGHE